MRSVACRLVLPAVAIAGIVGGLLVDRAQAQDLYANPNDAYEILFSRILQNPGNSTLNRQFAREAEARGDLRLAFAALERVVLSSPGDTLAQAEFDRLRNKMMPAVTLVTVMAGASYVSNPLQLPSKEYLVDNNSPLERGMPFSPHRPDDASFNASVAVADERTFGHLRWRTLALAQGQVQADVSELDSPLLAIATGPVFWLNPNLWMHVAGGADIVWLDGNRLYNGVSGGVTFGGLYRGLTQTLTARYDWRNGNDALVADDAQIIDLQGRFVASPSLVKADLFYFLPRLQISLNDTNPTGFIPLPDPPFGSFGFNRPLFPGDFTELGGAVAYYFPLYTGRIFLGAGIGVFERWYNESASSLRTVGICLDGEPGNCNFSTELVNINAGDRRDTYVEPTAHVIFPNLFGPSLDLRFDYRFEHNVSNASMTTTLKNGDIVTIPFDYDNHVAGVHVVGEILMIRLSISMLVALPLLALPLAARAAEVGTAAAVRNDVRGSVAGQMSNGSPVHQSETVSTGVESSTQLLFLDKTSLTMGPTSQVKIDKFVFDPGRGAKGTTVNLVKGALRVVTGSKHPEDFTVQTPLAYTGVRGSVGQIYVSVLGYEFIVNIEGNFKVCVRGGPCQNLDRPGQYIMVSPDGSMSPPAPWPGPMLDPTMSVAALETYFSNIIRRNYDVLPRYRDLNDALKSKDFSPSCFGEGCPIIPPP